MSQHAPQRTSHLRQTFSFGSLSSSQSPDGSRPQSPVDRISSANPFSTPPYSRAASTRGSRSGFQYAEVPGSGYFRSRRVPKANAVPLPVRKRKGEEHLLTIMPVTGLLLGLCISALLVFLKVKSISQHNYCPVLDEDFSSGTLDSNVWTHEIEVGGFGNQEFEQTTDDPENSFIKDGQLYIKPTLQDASLINTNNIINLTADGTCTSTIITNCVTSTNTTNGTIVNPVKSARLNTKLGASIKYGRVSVTAKIPKGDWLWPAIWLLPVNDTYGAWPASGEIDIMESRGNNYSYSLGGNNFFTSSLHWGPSILYDAYKKTSNSRSALHSQFGDKFHTFGMEWSEKYIFTWVDNTLTQALYFKFDKPLYPQGNFPFSSANGTSLVDPWSFTGRDSTPFDQEFYLVLNVAVGGQNGYFLDGADGKPWGNASPFAKKEFWDAQDQWYPTWKDNGQMIVDRVQMWQQC